MTKSYLLSTQTIISQLTRYISPLYHKICLSISQILVKAATSKFTTNWADNKTGRPIGRPDHFVINIPNYFC